ncbi:hypothetical protein V8B97DRAFT_2003249 [Scleroderma yunnanense]
MASYKIQAVLDGHYLREIYDRDYGPVVVIRDSSKPSTFSIFQDDADSYSIDATMNNGSGKLIYWNASIQRWLITFRPTHSAFTIQETNSDAAWTTPALGADLQILVRDLPDVPEQDLPTNVLFKLVPA